MNLEKELKDYKKTLSIVLREQNVKETVKKSIDVFYLAEQERLLNYWEFLWEQLRLVRKRWWCFQAILLLMLWGILSFLVSVWPSQRLIGAVSSLFVILIIPELWKSQTYQSMEIEAVSCCSLRQIYASRMLLFGIVDIVLVTLFCGLSSATLNMDFSQLLIQFIFPMTVTACICFGVLCSRHSFGEITAIIMCMIWSSIWMVIILSEKVYAAITFSLWLVLLGAALCFLVFAVYQTLRNCTLYWEENTNGIDIG